MRIQHLPKLHGTKCLGNVVQRDYMGVSGLRRAKRVRESVRDREISFQHFFEKTGAKISFQHSFEISVSLEITVIKLLHIYKRSEGISFFRKGSRLIRQF